MLTVELLEFCRFTLQLGLQRWTLIHIGKNEFQDLKLIRYFQTQTTPPHKKLENKNKKPIIIIIVKIQFLNCGRLEVRYQYLFSKIVKKLELFNAHVSLMLSILIGWAWMVTQVLIPVFLVFLFLLYRVDEIFAVIGEEMHVGLSWTCLYGKKKERSPTTMNPSKILQTTIG